ncbi:F420-dependent oxidoreductase [Pseudonocardia sp. EC080610-09]|uniref:LLM class F420-dependent oxidoreductase n=1 Tax=unclassified Pseudonocardia TaxID=2619320 RepID=UPI0006CB5410|nr:MULTISPECIES: LLM class F420-dependent oxidoreductase [unclassified Pseudonocardia]ALE72951.1 F420-dependent oxidoreductase [Pseudonocardia sp. EC080625-04]ALL76276.1 F420-dependent oxidoreductase [Pseudonocardia sp. EC080610-09]ALL83303.1 F420-dependent oxidoreductase [Pseudonocardia sp. EC080619-01]
MDFRIFTEPQQGATYTDLLRVALTTQDAGYDAFFRSDHVLAMGDGGGLPGPTDAWVTLAALGRETERIRLGTLVTSATFRLPGPLAVAVAQADEMSGGRIELGLGSGWFEAEHTAYGIPFPPLAERFEILTEQLEILTGMWATPPGERFSHRGTHYTVADSPALPRPVQDAPPVIVGGMGKRKTPALAARFASEFNVPFQDPDTVAAQFGRVREACTTAGRDPGELTYSVAQMLCLGRDDAEVARRAAAVGRDVDEVRRNCLAGTPGEIVDQLGVWSEKTGTTRIYLQILDLADLGHIEEFASSVVPQLA